jgi:type IV secretion system protein VirB8
MKFRKTKEQIIAQEQELAAGLVHDPARAQEISQAQAAYINAARWFETHVAEGHMKTAKFFKRLSAFFGLLAFMSIGAVLGLTPLKTVVPYLVRVDNNTGASDVVRPVSEVKDQSQRDDEFWLSTYVRFRESYNFADSDGNFAAVEVMSYTDTFAEYKNFQLSKKGYTETLGNNRQLRVEINNVVFLKREEGFGTAQVRLTKTVVDRNGVPDPAMRPATWLTTISYDYKNPPKKREQEWINPRGFGGKTYSSVQEVGVNHG